MRVARNDVSLVAGLIKSARQEARSGVQGWKRLPRKVLEQPRHVEVQVLGDQHGERRSISGSAIARCSGRHQKLVEESPAPHLPSKVRDEMCKAAVRLAKTAGYYQCRHVRVPRRQAATTFTSSK